DGIRDGHVTGVQTCALPISTVVETDIHFPTDCTLLWDAIRVLTRLVLQLGEHVPAARVGFTNHTRRARRRMQEISRMTVAQRAQIGRASCRERVEEREVGGR